MPVGTYFYRFQKQIQKRITTYYTTKYFKFLFVQINLCSNGYWVGVQDT